ncbi:MAG: TolB family protein, partial [Planctomycetota bacterium]
MNASTRLSLAALLSALSLQEQAAARQGIPAPVRTVLTGGPLASRLVLSRDGRYMVMVSGKKTIGDEVYRFRTDGTGLERLDLGMTRDQFKRLVPRQANAVATSADGSKIIFRERKWFCDILGCRYRNAGIWFLDLGKAKPLPVQVAPDSSSVAPHLSDDGKKVVYWTFGGAYIVNADGTGRFRISASMGVSGIDATASRVVGGFSFKDQDVAVINTDGTGFRNLTKTPGFVEGAASITPDGKKVAFGRIHGTQWGKQTTEIMIVNSDGTGLRSLAKVLGAASLSAISAGGTRIVMQTLGPTAETSGVFLVDVGKKAVLKLVPPAFPFINGNGQRLLSATLRAGTPVVLDFALPDLKALGTEQIGKTEVLQVAAKSGQGFVLGLSDRKVAIPLPPFGTLGLDPGSLWILAVGVMGKGRTAQLP